MIGAAAVVLIVTVLFAVLGPWLGRRLAPAMAARALVPASVGVAVATGSVLAVGAFTLLGQLPAIAEAGRWSASVVRAADPVPPVVALVSGLLVAFAATRAVVVFVRRVTAFIAVQRLCRDHGGSNALIVLDSARPDAFATPGRRGRVVVTTGLLRQLSGAERRAVLAHERSHVAHRHAWWVLAAELAAAANPLLTSIARAVAQAVERWADEDAAVEVGDRLLVARAVGRAAMLGRPATARRSPVCSAVGGDVPGRLRALLEPEPGRNLRHLAVLGLLLAVIAGGSALVHERARELFAQASISRQL